MVCKHAHTPLIVVYFLSLLDIVMLGGHEDLPPDHK